MLGEFFSLFQDELFLRVLDGLWRFSPIWLPILVAQTCFDYYISYKRREWINKQGSVVLEIKLPREVPRSPAGMELALYGLWEDVVGSLFDVYLKGQIRDWHSLEIVSIGGEVKFFIWTLPKWKKIIETRLYSQYPGVEVHEVSDYTRGVSYDKDTMKMFAVNTALVKPDIYPIRTYLDYKLEKTGEEGVEVVDPLVPLLEWLGSLGPHEQAWIQIMIQAHRAEKRIEDITFFPRKHWKEQIKEEVAKIIKESPVEKEDGKAPNMMDLTKVQQEVIEAIQRHQDKHSFEAMMRCLYFAPEEHYDNMGGAGLVGSMRQFGARNMNGIRPIFQKPPNAYPWQDFRGYRKHSYRSKMLDAYKRRSTFNGKYKNWQVKPYVLSVEELATLFHFPSVDVANTPTLSRIPSKKAEAPANLPI